MSDQNLTQLTATTSPTSDALVYIVDDPTGAPADRTITLTTLLKSSGGREKLTANRTYYVRTDGSDSNSGLVNDAGGAFLTIQAAVTLVATSINLGGYDVTIQVADGTYAAAASLSNQLDGNGTLSIKGNATTPTNVIVNGIFSSYYHASLRVRDLQCYGLLADSYGYLSFTNLVFVDSANTNLITASNEGTVEDIGDWKIAGGSWTNGLYSTSGGTIACQRAVTITSTPSFTRFILIQNGSKVLIDPTFSGSATGQRYFIENGSSLICIGATTTITSIPGNAMGYREAGSYTNLTSTESSTWLASDHAITSSTTLTDTALSLELSSARNYTFIARLYTTSNVAGGVKVAIAGTATATTVVYEGFTISGGTTTQTRATTLGTAVGGVTAVTAAYVEVKGSILTNAAGTLLIQFAQNASNAGATTLLAGSSFHVYINGE